MQVQQVFSPLSGTQHDLAVKRNYAPLTECSGGQQREDCGAADSVALNSIPRVLHCLLCCFSQGFNVLLPWLYSSSHLSVVFSWMLWAKI